MSDLEYSVTFFSNFLLHHQTPFCEEMVKRLGNGFTFVATRTIPEEQLKLGYHDLSHSASYALNAYEDDESMDKALRLAISSDVVIFGAAPERFVAERLKRNLLTFRYSERFFKTGYLKLLNPKVLWYHYINNFKPRNKKYYMLCASAYTARDCRLIHAFPGKTFKWGYFPETKAYRDISELLEQKRSHSILWAGRLIGWKHPDITIHLAEKLKNEGYSFTLNIIGSGVMEEVLKKMIEERNLSDCVQMLGSMPPEKVRAYMEQSEIFLFTSDRNEGWGAVLNESMNSACAVVANYEIGSVPFLIKDYENGLIYQKRFEDLYQKVTWLLDNPEKRKQLGRNAYESVLNIWSAKTATERFLTLCNGLLEDNCPEYDEGPCSRA